MKKLALIIIATLMAISGYSQKIKHDKTDKNGIRYITTSEKSISSHCRISLQAATSDNYGTIYMLHTRIYNQERIKEGSELIIKLENNEVITLYSTGASGQTSYTIGIDTGYTILPVTSYYTLVTYSIEEEQIKKIIEGKTVKIRIENDLDYIVDKIKKNKFSKRLSKLYTLTTERLKKPCPKVYTDDF